MTTASKRVGWLDTARALGIVAVVAGHVTADKAVWSAMYHFHMPLFFVLSGMVFKPSSVTDVAAKRARALLIPYLGWLLIVTVLDLVFAFILNEPFHLPWDRPIAAIARLVLGGTFLVEPYGTFWFVPCLFIVQNIANLVLRMSTPKVMLLSLAVLAGSYLVQHWPSPWGIISVPLSLFFFLIGGVYSRFGALAWRWELAVIAAAASALVFYSDPVDLKIGYYGTPILSVVAAIGVAHLLFVLSQALPDLPSVLAIGRASLVIMYLHLAIFYALRGEVLRDWIAFIAITIPMLMWWGIRQSPIGQRYLLGEKPNSNVAYVSR
jgi:fucose 4-O-acetylase-like acetyltransferase